MIEPITLINRFKNVGYKVNAVQCLNYRLRDKYSFHAHMDDRKFLITYELGQFSSRELTGEYRLFYRGPEVESLLDVMTILIEG